MNLRQIRDQLGWTQDELSKKAGLAATVVSNYESGARTPSLKNLHKLKRALGCTWSELLDKPNTKRP